jgi:hypothetical protein
MRKHNFTSKQLWRRTITKRPYHPCNLPRDYDDSLDTTESDKMDPSLNRIIPPEIMPPHEEEISRRKLKPDKVTFSNVAFVYLIPTNQELSEHVDLSFLYWNKLDYLRFKRDAIMQIQNYWKANGKSTNLGLILKEITERSIEETDQIADLILPPPLAPSSSFPNIKKAVEAASVVVVEKSATSPTSVAGVHLHKDEPPQPAPSLNRQNSVPSDNNENINSNSNNNSINKSLNSFKDNQDPATTEKPVSMTKVSSSSNDESATSCESSLSFSLSSSCSSSSSSFLSPPISADSFDEAQHQQPTVIPSVEEFLHFSLTALDSLHRQLSESHDQQEETTGLRELLTS